MDMSQFKNYVELRNIMNKLIETLGSLFRGKTLKIRVYGLLKFVI